MSYFMFWERSYRCIRILESVKESLLEASSENYEQERESAKKTLERIKNDPFNIRDVFSYKPGFFEFREKRMLKKVNKLVDEIERMVN